MSRGGDTRLDRLLVVKSMPPARPGVSCGAVLDIHELGAHSQVRAVYHTTAWVPCGHAALRWPVGAAGLLIVLAA